MPRTTIARTTKVCLSFANASITSGASFSTIASAKSLNRNEDKDSRICGARLPDYGENNP